MAREVSEKSSATQLWSALLATRKDRDRWRRVSEAKPGASPLAEGDVVVAQADLDAFKTEVETLRARARALESELSDAHETARATGIAEDTFAGKPALVDLRRAWERFATAVRNLPDTYRDEGMEAVRLAVASTLIPDLYFMGLTAPRSRSEARQRDRIRRFLDHPAMLRLLCRDEPWAERGRAAFLSAAARAFLRPSVYQVYEKGAERALLDDMGTVMKG